MEINRVACERAGITPGYPGLYQINVWLPDAMTNPNPELRVALGDQISQVALSLPVALSR